MVIQIEILHTFCEYFWIKGYSANISVKINGKASRSYWFNIGLLLIDSKNFAELIFCLFFSSISWNINFSRMQFKGNFAKSNEIRQKNIRENIIRIPVRWRHRKLRIIFKNNFSPMIFREWLKQWKYQKVFVFSVDGF